MRKNKTPTGKEPNTALGEHHSRTAMKLGCLLIWRTLYGVKPLQRQMPNDQHGLGLPTAKGESVTSSCPWKLSSCVCSGTCWLLAPNIGLYGQWRWMHWRQEGRTGMPLSLSSSLSPCAGVLIYGQWAPELWMGCAMGSSTKPMPTQGNNGHVQHAWEVSLWCATSAEEEPFPPPLLHQHLLSFYH